MMNSLCTILQGNFYIMMGGGYMGRNFNNNIGLGCMKMLSEEYAYF
jgi:hypothetical protein